MEVSTLTSLALLFNSSFESAVVLCSVHQHIQKSCKVYTTQYYHEKVCAKKSQKSLIDRVNISGRWVDLGRKVNNIRTESVQKRGESMRTKAQSHLQREVPCRKI